MHMLINYHYRLPNVVVYYLFNLLNYNLYFFIENRLKMILYYFVLPYVVHLILYYLIYLYLHQVILNNVLIIYDH